jgi:hypothetical protein
VGGGSVTAISVGTGSNNNVDTLTFPSGTSNGLNFAGVVINNDDGTEVAWGAIADSSGTVFVATGDIDELLDIQASVTRQLIYTGADLTLGLAGSPGGETGLQVYAGPSYRGLFQQNTTDVTVNAIEAPVDDVGDDTVVIRELTISSADNLTTHYLGGVVGGNVSFPSGDTIFHLGLEGGLYGARASWTGQDTTTVCCGSVNDVATLEGEAVSDAITADFEDALAFAARANAGVTFVTGANHTFTLAGSAEYLSHVATVDHGVRLDFDPGATTADWDSGENDPGDPTFSWGGMVNLALTGTITGHF